MRTTGPGLGRFTSGLRAGPARRPKVAKSRMNGIGVVARGHANHNQLWDNSGAELRPEEIQNPRKGVLPFMRPTLNDDRAWTHCVYLLLCPEAKGNVYVKVGISSDWWGRFNSLRTACPIFPQD